MSTGARGEVDLNGSVALITGATRGIGRQTARILAQAGSRVVIVGRSTAASPHRRLPGTVEDVVRELETFGGEVLGVPADLSSSGDVTAVIDTVMDRFGRCDILVSNAAFMWTAPVLDSPVARFLTAYQVNVVAFAQLVQGLVPGMLERGAGRVIAVSSGSAAPDGRPNFSVYGASKAALERLSNAMHTELSGRGVSFNTLRIDETVPTEIYQLSEDTGAVANPVPASEMYTPQQVAGALVWMARQPAAWSGKCVGFEDLRRAGVLSPHGG